jgi:RHS repeat-associated protein
MPAKRSCMDRTGETGLDCFGVRYFPAAQGRFTTVDPKLTGVPFPEHLANPQRWNIYAYAPNNPLRFIDPNGEDIELVITFQGNYTGRILETLRQYLSKLDFGRVQGRDSASADKRTTMQLREQPLHPPSL